MQFATAPLHAQQNHAEPASTTFTVLPEDSPPVNLSGMLMRVLDEIDYGLIMVNDQAEVRYANHLALDLCRAKLGFQIQGGKVQLGNAVDQKALLKALWQARRGTRSLVPISQSKPDHMLAVVPLDVPQGRATLLLLSKSRLCEPLSIDFFARHHHLTPSEGVVLRALCEGQKPDSVATSLGVATSTIRTHVRSIRAKTATTTISDLVRRVLALPPIACALHSNGAMFPLEAEMVA